MTKIRVIVLWWWLQTRYGNTYGVLYKIMDVDVCRDKITIWHGREQISGSVLRRAYKTGDILGLADKLCWHDRGCVK